MNSSNKNFLENVILRFDFKDDIIIPDDVVSDITKNISPEFIYGLSERTDLKINVESSKISTENRKIKIHTFKNNSGFTITLESDYLSFSTLNYSSYKDFMTLVKKVISLLQISNEELKRLGLRYINHIRVPEGNPFEWNGYIVPELTQSIHFVNNFDNKHLSRNMGHMYFKEPDHSLIFLYGWSNSEFPNPIAKKEFVLDYDCFTENQFKLSEAYEYIDNFHVEIKKMFVKSINDELKKKIGEDKLCVI